MFRFLDTRPAEVDVTLDGAPLKLPGGISLAAALIATNQSALRQTVQSGAPRAAYCMMGSCFECLIEINGINQPACQVTVEQGMQLRRVGSASTPGSIK